MNREELASYRKAGKIASEVVRYAKSIIKKGMLLREIADKIEEKIQQLGGKPAFPVDLGINEIAAHYTPSSDDTTKASGLLKIDIGVQVNGYIVDTAFSVDLETSKLQESKILDSAQKSERTEKISDNNEENKKLIEAAEKALAEAIKITKEGVELWKIGEAIQKTITSYKFSPVRNLSGHEIARYKIHAGLTIPNVNNNNKTKLQEGVYAIEPFSTNGLGLVYEGKSSKVYSLTERKPVRDKEARKILDFIEQEYKTLPFCERWINKKFPHSLLALNFLEKQGILRNFPELVEKGRGKVAQAETTILISKNKVEVLIK